MSTDGVTRAGWYAAAMRCTSDAMLVADAGGAILDMNTAAEALLGVALDDARGRALADVLRVVDPESHEDVPVTARSARPAALAEGSLLLRPDGSRVPIAGVSTRAVDDVGGHSATLVALRDLSERERLLQRLTIADRMSAVGMVAASIGHELNNPLSYVAANLDFARMELDGTGLVLPQSVTEALAEARVGAERAARITKQLRSWARADREPARVLDLRSVLERAASTAWVEIRHRARFTKEYRPSPPVLADELRLGQVFLVLLVNAARAIPEGEPEANEIRVVTTRDADGAAVVEVRDTGRGIPPDDLDAIFEPFYTTRPEEGAGLGLAVARSIVSGLGGRLEVESQPGRGTTFRVVLPPSIADGSGEAIVDGRGRPLNERPAARILMVDDEELICGAVQRALSGEYQVTTFTSGRAALDHLLAGHRYDAILLDLMMPGMTGMQLYAELEKVAPEQVSRVVFLTGGVFTQAASQFLHDASHRRLEKPFDTRALQGVLAELVG